MTKWICNKCMAGNPCSLNFIGTSTTPKICPFIGTDIAEWRTEDSDRKEPEQKQETELPDWCKVGEWIFDVNEDCYAKVLYIDDLITLHYRGEKDLETRSKLYINDCCKHARLIPYTDDELKALVGKVVERGNFAHLVTDFQDDEGCFLRIYGIWYNAEELRTKGFELGNNIPCGTLEHLTNYGEWKR